MPQFVDVVVDTGGPQGVAPAAEVSSRDGGAPAPVKADRAAKAEPTGPLAFAKDTHAVSSVGRPLKASTLEKIAAIAKAQAAEAPTADDDESADEAAPEVEDAADAVEPAEDAAD